MKSKILCLCALFFIASTGIVTVRSGVSHAQQYNYDTSSGRLSSVLNEDNNSIIIYNYDRNGNVTSKKSIKTPTVQSPNEVNLLDDSYEIYAYGVNENAVYVTFPTWTDYNGNDDLTYPWVPGQKVADGVWKAAVPLSDHNNETGLYYNDVWVDGTYFGGTKTTVVRNNIITPDKVYFKDGSYVITVEGIREDVSRMTFYTWTEANGQDDLQESSGQKISSHTWKINIPFSEHNFETGVYTTHIYTTDNYGNRTGVGVQTEVVSSVEAPASINLQAGSYEVFAYGIKSDAVYVTFPTWTEYQGNDDLEYPWVAGQKVSNGVWKATVPFSKHNNETGLYYNDVWVDGAYFGGCQTIVSSATISFQDVLLFFPAWDVRKYTQSITAGTFFS